MLFDGNEWIFKTILLHHSQHVEVDALSVMAEDQGDVDHIVML